MPYIGKTTDGFGVRNRFVYLASASDTSVSGADANGATLTFTDGAYVDVYLNGVLLKSGTDYNTNTANTIAGISSMAANDEVTVVVYDVFTVADTVSATSGGTFSGNVTHSGTVTVDDTTDSTSTTTGSIQTDGGVGIAKDLVVGDDILLKSDDGAIQFGADGEITLTHRHNDGLILKHTGTGSGSRPALAFHAGETEITSGDVLGKIEFQAPDEASGTDAVLIGAEIRAVAEDTFSASNNETRLEFRTGNSESATTKMSIDGDGNVGIGTTSPDDHLTVEGFIRLNAQAGDANYIRFDNTDNSGNIWRIGPGVYSHTTFSIYNQTDNSQVVNIESVNDQLMFRSMTQISLADDATAIAVANSFQGIVVVTSSSNALTGIYRCEGQNTPTLISGTSSFTNSDTDGKFCLISAGGSSNVTFRNRFGATYGFKIAAFGVLS